MAEADIIRGTTPTITVTSEDLDFTAYTCFLSAGRMASDPVLYSAYFTADDSQMTKTTSDGTSVIACTLTQEQTLEMRPGDCILQLRAVDSGGTAVASYAVPIEVADVTQRGVIYHG
jgi:hypothetical protein